MTTTTRHSWFQTDAVVTVDIFIKNLVQEHVKVHFMPASIQIAITDTDTLDFKLLHHISVADCSFTITKTKLEIRLGKKDIGLKWQSLEDAVVKDTLPSYPTSALKKTDWAAAESGIKKASEPEGDKQLNAFFQDIFKDATPEAQRAMQKSFVESNGTCLSTNWSEVGNKRVEVTPPDGMVARPYEK